MGYGMIINCQLRGGEALQRLFTPVVMTQAETESMQDGVFLSLLRNTVRSCAVS